MPKIVNPLTDIQVKNAKPKDKPYKFADGGGLYIEVMQTREPLRACMQGPARSGISQQCRHNLPPLRIAAPADLTAG